MHMEFDIRVVPANLCKQSLIAGNPSLEDNKVFLVTGNILK